ncbi:gamma-butyrobetaine hydroxylase-like domain-containing protein [Thioalkalivibrio sp. HK1]|uniref:gamma-butyrobetaine hydroxylase-like domain-containing protein n=1 Tax=Thioalkalivibrio sp. HK1 TaxID=1469245 RepID=UPI0004727D7F|nr:gamma-butyrobetaine hydroxylase-like domain-containing protein [Thioalkalivibrio sp. HK1]
MSVRDIDKGLPKEIRLDRKRRILSIEFADATGYELPFEYLRIFSPADDTGPGLRHRGSGIDLLVGKENVMIESVEPVGGYAVRLRFDDGHDTGVYSFDTLCRLGRDRDRNQAHYLDQLERAGHSRPRTWDTPEDDWVEIKILYFATVAEALDRLSEEILLPDGIHTVDALLEWLRERGDPWTSVLHPDRVQVSVNRRFSLLATRLLDGDEVAITPSTVDDR